MIIWKDIKGYEGYYKISDNGQVKSLINDIILKPHINYGYHSVTLKGKKVFIHKLVVENFILNYEKKDGYVINHINGIKSDNNIKNLEIITYSENTKHAYKNSLIYNRKKTTHTDIFNSLLKRILEIYNNIEKWVKPVYNGIIFENYIISTKGEIKKINTDKKIKLGNDGRCYFFIEGKFRAYSINEILIETFINHISIDNEKWCFINEYPNYQVSNLGNIRSIKYINGFKKYKKIIGSISTHGYHQIILWNKKGRKGFVVHRLVAEAFITNDDPINKIYVNHIDGNKLNNYDYNLNWMSPSDNTTHAYSNGLINTKKGENHTNSTLTEKEVIEIFYMKGKQKEIATIYNTKQNNVSRIKNKTRWKHILQNL